MKGHGSRNAQQLVTLLSPSGGEGGTVLAPFGGTTHIKAGSSVQPLWKYPRMYL